MPDLKHQVEHLYMVPVVQVAVGMSACQDTSQSGPRCGSDSQYLVLGLEGRHHGGQGGLCILGVTRRCHDDNAIGAPQDLAQLLHR